MYYTNGTCMSHKYLQKNILTASRFVLKYTKQFPGCKPDPLEAKTAKSFLLFYKTGRKGRIGHGDAVTDSSAETIWKCFMTAWQRKTGQQFPKPLRDTILNVRNAFLRFILIADADLRDS
jgi:hypothetical protein